MLRTIVGNAIVRAACRLGLHDWRRGAHWPVVECGECDARADATTQPRAAERWH